MKEIRPAAAVLRRATPELTALLNAVERFSSAANDTVIATRQQLFALLAETEPVLAELASNRGRFSYMMQRLVKAAGALREAVPGDYASISIDLHLDGIQAGNLPALQGLLDLIGITAPIVGRDRRARPRRHPQRRHRRAHPAPRRHGPVVARTPPPLHPADRAAPVPPTRCRSTAC